jgi:hypothetical protein
MASNPPGRCCTIGVKHEGEAKGEIKAIDSSWYHQQPGRVKSKFTYSTVSTYFAYPEDKSTENAILILTDVIGHKFINAQLYIHKTPFNRSDMNY